jgi:hypothetical protein
MGMRKLLLILFLFNVCQAQTPLHFLLAKHRSNAFIPTDTAGCTFWVKGDGITGLSDGDPISTWPDGSASANNATQTGSNRAIWKASQLDGKAAVRFDGVDDYFNLTSTLPSNADYTLFVVYKKRTAAAKMATLGKTADAFLYSWLDFSDDNVYLFSHGGIYYTSPAGFTSFTLIEEQWNGMTVSTWKNASTFSLSNGSASSSTSAYNVVGNSRSGDYADGDIAEIIYYDHALTTTGRTTVENYLHTRYPSLY